MNLRMLKRFALAALTLLLLKPFGAFADEIADPAELRAAAEQAVRAAAGSATGKLEVTAETLDERLRLAACAGPLLATIAGDGQLRERTTVNVRCNEGTRWSIYMGVNLASELPVLVAQRPLAIGSVPAAADFEVVVRRLPGVSSRYVGDVAQLAGQRMRRPLALGEALAADALAIAPIVHRGQQLTLVARAGGMEVRTTGIALADGRPAERIRVQNLASQKVIEAVVRGPDLAEVAL
jgi:flagella basal body P-ring formation protein FlgA